MEMAESLVGVSVAVNLQNANGADTVICVVPLLAGVWKGAVISTADVIVPSSMGKSVRLAHVVAACTGGVDASRAHASPDANKMETTNCLMILMLASLFWTSCGR